MDKAIAADIKIKPPNTHADRPTPKAQLPFRILMSDRPPRLEYEQLIILPDYSTRRVPMYVIIDDTQYGNPLGLRIQQLMTAFKEVEGRVDGLLASVDMLTTENLLKDREIEKLTNQLEEMKRRTANNKGK